MDLSMDILELHALIRDLLARVSMLESESTILRAENAVLRAENLSLKARLGQDSSNSYKPPSSDGYAQKPAAAFNRKTGKKVGVQLGRVETIIIEVNSLPGMTPATCIFHQCALNGYKPYQFIDEILDFGAKM
jgi:regulator of replication initiation timing